MQFVMVMSGGAEAPLIFGDLEKDSRVLYLPSSVLDLNSCFLEKLRHVHLSSKISRYVCLPLKCIWNNTLSLSQVSFQTNENYKIIFIITSLARYNISYLRMLKKQYSIDYYLYMLDSVDSKEGQIIARFLKEKNLFSGIYSFDMADCQRYGFKYFMQPLRTFTKEELNLNQCQSDLYFLGRSKGRTNLLMQIKDANPAISCNFQIIPDAKDNKALMREKGVLSGYVSYEDNVRNVLSTNVILEVVQGVQSGNTLRYQEAIIYNKKLLTNNSHVKEFPFYDERFIKVFQKIEDIDFDWVKEKETVDYGYNGEFSASRFIDQIVKDSLLEEKG